MYLFLYIQGKLLSKLYKMKKSSDILICQVYLPKLHENVLKYYRLNLFKEIAISYNHGLKMTSESPKTFLTVSLVKLVNATITFVSSWSLVLLGVFLVSFSTVSYT